MTWLKMYDGLRYADASKRANKIKRDGSKLRAMGCEGWDDVEVRLSFQGPGHTEYAVWVARRTA